MFVISMNTEVLEFAVEYLFKAEILYKSFFFFFFLSLLPFILVQAYHGERWISVGHLSQWRFVI